MEHQNGNEKPSAERQLETIKATLAKMEAVGMPAADIIGALRVGGTVGSLDDEGRYMADPVVVERKDLERIGDALGEIGVHLPWLRQEIGPCSDELLCVMEAQVEGAGLVRRMLGKCFNPDRSFLEDICDAIDPKNEGAGS